MNDRARIKAAETKKRSLHKDYTEALNALLARRQNDPTISISYRSVAREAKRNHVSLSEGIYYEDIRNRIIEESKEISGSQVLTPNQKVIASQQASRELKRQFSLMATKYQDIVLQLRERERLIERLRAEIQSRDGN